MHMHSRSRCAYVYNVCVYAYHRSDAAAMAIIAGVDQDMPGGAYLSELAPLVRAGGAHMCMSMYTPLMYMSMCMSSRLSSAQVTCTCA